MQSYALEMSNITNKTDSSLFKALKMKFKIYVGAIWQESKLVLNVLVFLGLLRKH